MNRYLDNALAAALHHELEADLVADRSKLVALFEGRTAEREVPGHRIGHGRQRPREEGGDAAVQPAKEAPVVRGRAAIDVPGSDDKIRARLELGKHVWKSFGWMAEIRVHADEHLTARPAHAVEHGGAETAVSRPDQNLHPRFRT